MKKYILMALSLLSFLPNGAYMFQAWSSSRLDSWDWCFFLLAIPALIRAWDKNAIGNWDRRAFFILLPALGAIAAKNVHEINALSVIGSIFFVWGTAFLAGSWHFAYRLLPVLGILLMGTPSSSYRIAQMLTVSTAAAMGMKFIFAAGCFGWICANKRFERTPRVETVLFAGALLVSAVTAFHADELYFSGKSFIPELPTKAGIFYGRHIEPDKNTKRFFATSHVEQYRYIASGEEISVLKVRCGKNIHEIHPPSHCLRTSRWVVTSEKMLLLKDDLAVTEIEAFKGNYKALIWVWYSSDEFSTPGFLGFRRKFRNNGRYHTFQISIPVRKNVETSRDVLKKFIDSLEQKKIK